MPATTTTTTTTTTPTPLRVSSSFSVKEEKIQTNHHPFFPKMYILINICVPLRSSYRCFDRTTTTTTTTATTPFFFFITRERRKMTKLSSIFASFDDPVHQLTHAIFFYTASRPLFLASVCYVPAPLPNCIIFYAFRRFQSQDLHFSNAFSIAKWDDLAQCRYPTARLNFGQFFWSWKNSIFSPRRD